MKRIIVSLLCVSLLALVLILGFTRLNSNVSAQQPRQIEATILTCANIRDDLWEVLTYTGSTRTPSIHIKSNCAQALADLLNNGFEIRGVSEDLLVYVLVKEVHNTAWM